MITSKTAEPSKDLASQASASADRAIKSTQRVAIDALDAFAGSVQTLRNQAEPLLNRSGEQIGALAQRGIDAVYDGSQQLRDRALRASDSTLGYIKDEPVKAVLVAAAAGAALMAPFGLMRRSLDRG